MTIVQASSIAPAEPLLPRATLSPTHFTSLHLDGLALDRAVQEYFDWIEGVGPYARRRSSRASQGVPSGFDRDALLHGASPVLANGCELTARSKPGQVVLRFVHRDDEVPEIWWHSVIRLSGGDPAQGVLVEHATGRAMPPHLRLPPVAGAPAVVGKLCGLPGVSPRARDLLADHPLHVRKDDADAFVRHVLVDEHRSHPYVIVSPIKDSGAFLVDPEVLAKRLSTQAVVAILDTNATWAFSDAFKDLGFDREYGVCFDGAVRVYQTGLKNSRSPRDHFLWLPGRLKDYAPAATERTAGEVAERITWRALPPRFFAILEDWDRNESRARAAELLHRDAEGAKSLQDRLAAQDRDIADLRVQLQAAQEERGLWEKEVGEYEGEVNEMRQLMELAEQERDEAKQEAHLASVHLANLKARDGGLDENQQEALRGVLRGGPNSLEQALHIIEALFSGRVVLLPSAWSSAQESAAFQKPEKAFELMLILVQEYWSAIQEGGDSAGKKYFTDATFAPRESETVESRKGARERRTFKYNGAPLVMWKHLKIGVKDSIAETWRLHFEFDAEAKRIIVGHCGKHLDFK